MKRNKWLKLGLILACSFALSGIAFASGKGKVKKNDVNVRKTASTSADVVTHLSKGDDVTILETEGDWYKIQTEKYSGYVRKDMITVTAESAEVATKESPANVYIVKDSVNIRDKASTNGKIIMKAEKGAKFSVVNVEGDWYKIECDSKKTIGYIRNDMCTTAVDSTPATTASTDTGVITGSGEEVLSTDAATTTTATTAEATESAKLLTATQAQEILKKLNFYSKEVDGKWGTISLAALKSFQRAYNLEIDGKLGDTTDKALENALINNNGSSAAQVAVSSNGVVLAEWFNAMKDIVPKYEHLRVVDVETGVEFKLRAFSLGNHADVEPPTKEDTDILYRINGNKWSWTPRAIWVYIDGKAYAAAINVMPHGPDTLPNNGMSGQICMHFLHSRQHNTGQENNNLQKAILHAWDKAAEAPAYDELAKSIDDATLSDAPLAELSYDEMMALIDEEE